ncbi:MULTISPECIES: DUF2231 domain-containing protein [unclassified Aeromicrobium]|uniref:DUF2231 domain-containing protein n=1 Tax=unclassified Aeromicrobium TaxID=2633570 RepID=UPI002096D45F|nr:MULTISPECIES: DUF2231 domain-containing protein [unclassified Aeromicrobium]MCO7241026.1 hypothetical protein [Aeromicrobium sp. CnD17-E]MDR6117461.1 putative membrane protein [Aeromicrobium sp. SORGH_AS_0981]
MLDTFNGLPLHPLVVHAVVVLLPLSVVGAIVVALRPAWRQTYGWLVASLLVVATALTPVATSSGEALEKRVGDPGRHAELGDQLIWFEIALLVVLVAMLVLHRRGVVSAAARGVAVLVLIASVAAAVQVYRVGDSGAKAVWGDTTSEAGGS